MSRDKVKDLRDNISIIDYLKSKGIDATYRKKFSCPSLNHEDKHPSCIVYKNAEGDYFRCFGCGIHGDIFNLVGELENLTHFVEQLNFLQEYYGRK